MNSTDTNCNLQAVIPIADEDVAIKRLTAPLAGDGLPRDKSQVLFHDQDIEDDVVRGFQISQENEMLQKLTPLQRRMYFIFVKPKSPPAKLFSYTCLLFIMVYTVMALLETIPEYMTDGRSDLSEHL